MKIKKNGNRKIGTGKRGRNTRKEYEVIWQEYAQGYVRNRGCRQGLWEG